MQNYFIRATTTVSVALGLGGLAYMTDSQADQAAAENQLMGALEEIVVTARRRDEMMRDVPIAMSAITGNQAERMGIDGTDDLAITTPSLDFSRQGGFAYIPFLRGIGTSSASAGQESPIAIYVDDVYIASPNGKLFSLDNVESVQVLKGPQGTLFGRNATGGVIQITTRQPDLFEPTARVAFGYGDYDTIEGSLYANVPISDSVAMNIAASGSEQGEGYGRSVVTGRETQKTKDWNVRAQMLINAGDHTTVKLSVDYSDTRTDEGWNQGVLPGSASLFGDTFVGEYNTNTDGTDFTTIEQTGVALNIEHEFSFANLMSISAYRETEMITNIDQDGGQIEFSRLFLDSPTETFSQELRLVSNSDGPLQWVGGLYYMSMDASYEPACLCGMVAGVPVPFPAADPTGELRFENAQELDSYSVFGEGTYDFSDATSLTLGVRYTEDSYEYIQDGIDLFLGDIPIFTVPLSAYTVGEDFNKTTYRGILDHQVTPDVMAYISHSRGFKSGGYNLTEPGVSVAPTGVVEPEILDATEIGLKSSFLDGRLTFNLSAFYYDYENLIVTITTNNSLNTINGPKAEIKGVDGDLVFLPADGWRIAGGFGYLDSEYTKFPNGPVFIPIPGGGNAAGLADLTGNETQRAPEFTFNLAPSYTFRAGKGDMTFVVSYYHNSGWYSDAENRLEQPSYDLINASLAYQMDNGFSVRLWGKNLSDDRYFSFLQGAELNENAGWAPPRTYGVALSQEF